MVGSLLSNRPLDTIASGNWVCSSLAPPRRPRPAGRDPICSRCSSVSAGDGGVERTPGRGAVSRNPNSSGVAAGASHWRRGVSGGDERHGEAVFHFRVHRRAHDDLRALAMASDLFHHAADLGHGQILSAHQAHEHGVGFGQGAAFIQQRMGEEFFDRFARAGGAAGLDKGKRALGMAVAHQRAQVVKMDLDQPGPREQLPDAAHAFDEQAAGDAEGVQDAGVLVNQFEGLLVRQANHAVGDGFQLFQALLRLLLRGGCLRTQTAA